MTVTSAITLIDLIVYRPGWSIRAIDHTKRYAGAVKVRIEYPAANTDRDQAPGYAQAITARAEFAMIVADCDDVALHKQILDAILRIEEHEAREFYRVHPTNWAPFHPHHAEGTLRWGSSPERDLQFGVI
jgi:hypothetical protein